MYRSLPVGAVPRARGALRRALAIGLTATLLLSLVVTLGSGQAEAAPDPLSCEGYPEPRLFMEGQDWWQPTLNGDEDHGHVHAGTCFPTTHRADGSVNAVSGKIRFDVRATLHTNPGVLRYVRVQLTDRDSNTQVARVDIDEACTPDTDGYHADWHGCEWWVPVEVDTSVANYDGFQEVRIAAVTRLPNGDEMRNSTGFQLYLDNGKPVRHYRSNSDGSPRPFIEGRGWYEGAKYTVARLEDRLPLTVSGVWEPRVQMRPGSGGVDVEHAFASLNGNFHHGDPGTVLLDQPGSYDGRLRIDTTKLPDGPNRLFLRADAPCDGTSGNDCGTGPDGTSLNVSTNSGALALTFIVDNGTGGTPTDPGHGGHHPEPTPDPTPDPEPTPDPDEDEDGDVPPADVVAVETVTGEATSDTAVRTDAALDAAGEATYLAAVSRRLDVPVRAVSGLGLDWTRVAQQCAGRGQTGVELWIATGSPTSGGKVTAHLEETTRAASLAVTRYRGVDQAAPVAAVTGGNSNGPDGACRGGSDSDRYRIDLAHGEGSGAVHTAVTVRNRRHTALGSAVELARAEAGDGGNATSTVVLDAAPTSPTTSTSAGQLSGATDWAVIAVALRAAS